MSKVTQARAEQVSKLDFYLFKLPVYSSTSSNFMEATFCYTSTSNIVLPLYCKDGSMSIVVHKGLLWTCCGHDVDMAKHVQEIAWFRYLEVN